MPVKCRVCGQIFQKITNQHIASHGITRESYNQLKKPTLDVIPSKKLTKSLLSGLQATMAKNENFPQHLQQAVDNITKDSDYKFKVALAALSWHKIGRIQRLMEVTDRISDKLFSHDNISQATTRDLLKLWELATNEQNEAVNLIKSASDSAIARNDPNLTFALNNSAAPKDPASRKIVSDVITQLLKVLDDKDKPVEEIPSSDENEEEIEGDGDEVGFGVEQLQNGLVSEGEDVEEEEDGDGDEEDDD